MAAARHPPPQRPRYNLEDAKKRKLVIPQGCVKRADTLLLFDSLDEVRKYVAKLFQSLTANDFAHVEPMRGHDGAAFYGDVYGKRDSRGLWFIKIRADDTTTTVILSCHEAERPIALADGRTLRKDRP